MTSATSSSSAEHPAVARWRSEQRNPRVSGEKLLVFAFVVAASLVLFPLAWLLTIQRHAALLTYAPVAWVVVCVSLWILLPQVRGLRAAFLAGSFAMALLVAATLALVLLIPTLTFVPLAIFTAFPCIALWVLVRPTRALFRTAPFATRPIASTCAALCGSVLPIVACCALHFGIVARGDEYLVALASADAPRIERAAARFRPFAPWIGIERRAIGDSELGPMSVGSSESCEMSTLEWKLDRARAPFRW